MNKFRILATIFSVIFIALLVFENFADASSEAWTSPFEILKTIAVGFGILAIVSGLIFIKTEKRT